jgi:methionyl-tRNA formyltransferase
MRLVRAMPIGFDEPAGSVHDRLAALGAEAIVEALQRLDDGALPIAPQPAEGVTYAAKITKADAVIDWTEPPRRLVDRLRAFDPAPGCVAELERVPGTVLKLWRARVTDRPTAPAAAPGTVLAVGDGAVTVACGAGPQAGAVELLELQRPGGRRMSVREFLAGFPVRPGDRLRAPGTSA